MCGIGGIVAITPSAPVPSVESLTRMTGALFHRGPDEAGLYLDDRAGLVHARLSIVDIASGQQPLADEGDRSWIVFNGEIFNYLELRKTLVALGHCFRTNSDTEVVIHAYRAWGECAFRRMNGQWALALWDAVAKRLVLCRDPFGICPLHICEYRGHVYFASEVKAIFAANPMIPRMLDPAGIDQTFTFWTVVPPQGVFVGVQELEPGHIRTYEAYKVHDRAYWEPRYPHYPDSSDQFRGSLEDAVIELRRALEAAIELRMLRADVPIGSYLSGGLDSSLIASIAHRHSGRQFNTFSLEFEDSEFDESRFQRAMVDLIGSKHRSVTASQKDIARVLPEVVYHAERPILRTASAPLFLLSKLVRECGIKAVLTGEGADELFAGYDLFREAKVRRYWAREATSQRRPLLLRRLYPYLERSPVSHQAVARHFFGRGIGSFDHVGFSHELRWRTTSALKRLFSNDMQMETKKRNAVVDLLQSLPGDFVKWSPLAQDQYLEKRTLLSGYLLSSQGDRMLMAHSVEGRLPYLDREIVSLANSLPPSFKLRVLDEKHVLRRVAKGVVPECILARKKQPYRAPDARCFVGGNAPVYVSEMLSESMLKESNIFEPVQIGRLVEKCRRDASFRQLSNADDMALVGVLSTQLLYRHFVASTPWANGSARFMTYVDKTSSAGG